jgi:potassium uptake TrkH family protein
MNFNFINKTPNVSQPRKKIIKTFNTILPYLSIANFFVILYDVGFDHTPELHFLLEIFYSASLVIFWVAFLLRLFSLTNQSAWKGTRIVEYVIFVSLTLLIIARFFLFGWISENIPFMGSLFLVHLLFIAVFFIELSKISLAFYKIQFDPAFLYIGSFFVLILFGTGLLLLPNTTTEGISLIDAFFTATSAVCVTGLIVLDTATDFTASGKVILLILIQIGGLGVMTLTSFFGFFFQGAYSYQSQIFLKDFINEEKIGHIFRTLFKIIFFTLFTELLGAVIIFFILDAQAFTNVWDRAGFALFHSISAFCNAGFSTLTDGLYDENFRNQYDFQLVIILLIIIGGIGFPVIFNSYRYLKYYVGNRVGQIVNKKPFQYDPRVLNINTKLVLITTISLLIVGTILFYITEQDQALANRSLYGKLVTAFFGSVTPRTAGFNTVDMTVLTTPTILFYLLFMWIGASPGSTGGGIKTTTFAVALLNTLSIAKVKDRVEVYRREITDESIRRAFAVMLLSFLAIGLAVFLVSILNPEMDLIVIAFECFSAYSTVGLSLGITADLSFGSKIVIMFTMFLGRVGTLTLLVAFIRNVTSLSYRYPEESVFIS